MQTRRRNRARCLAALTAMAAAIVLAQSSARAQCLFPGFDAVLTDGESFTWDVQKNGTISNGTIDAYDVGQALNVNGTYFPAAASFTTELGGRQIVHGPTAMSGLNVTRRVYVPTTEGWARFLEYFQNPTASPVTVTVRIETNAGSDGGTQLITTSSGDATYTTADGWLITDDADGINDPTLTHEFWGTGGTLQPNAVGMTVFDCAATNGPFAQFSLTVPASSTRILMHFGAQSPNQASAAAKAPLIAGLPASTVSGIPSGDMPLIVNWQANCGNGVIDAGETCDDGNRIDGDCCSSACQFQGSNPGCSTAADIFPSGSYAGPFSNWMVGWSFTPVSDMTVTALGMTDMPHSAFNPPTPSDGLLDPHQVGIWTASQTLLGSATLPAGTGSLLVDNIRYVAIPPVVLTAGQTYVIGAFLPVNDGTNDDVVDGGTFNFDPRLTFVDGRKQFSVGAFGFPTTTVAAAQFGPSFLFFGRCGDGVIDGGETCDDHNTVGNDGCDATCHLECGNGVLNGSEQCDDHNTVNGDCCSSTCTYEPATTVCRAAAGVCDQADTCTGSSGTCPADAKLSDVCRPATDLCDAPESCDGVSNDCPADGVAPFSTPCRASTGDCDPQEVCDGSSAQCPPDQLSPFFTLCRGSAGACDLEEYCTGFDANCPTDLKSGSVCRGASDLCDAVEICDGVGNDCPADAVLPPTTTCRAAVDDCDIAEHCDGSSMSCPADAVVPDSDGDTLCDAVDPCTNTSLNPIAHPRIIVRKLLTPAGDDKLRFKGEVLLPHPFTPALDPIAHGARLVVEDSTGATVVDATLPPGAYNSGTHIGWKPNAAGNRWTYVDPNGGVSGIVRMAIKDNSSKTPGLVKFTAVGKDSTYPTGVLPLSGTIVIDSPTAETGQCGEITFAGPAPAPACSVKAGGDKVLCK